MGTVRIDDDPYGLDTQFDDTNPRNSAFGSTATGSTGTR